MNTELKPLPSRQIKDLRGQRFGKLVVVEYAGKKGHRRTLWLCKCDCGTEKTIAGGNLLHNHHTRSCGCNGARKSARNVLGMTFSKLTVLRLADVAKSTSFWVCKCECGKEVVVHSSLLVRGIKKSCGCLMVEWCKSGQARFKHGYSHSSEYGIYSGAYQRCTNPNSPAYKHYGGRGIEFRFSNFEEFLAEVGLRPSMLHSLDRIDNNGHYEKGNLRWATYEEQQRNRRCTNCDEIKDRIRALNEYIMREIPEVA